MLALFPRHGRQTLASERCWPILVSWLLLHCCLLGCSLQSLLGPGLPLLNPAACFPVLSPTSTSPAPICFSLGHTTGP